MSFDWEAVYDSPEWKRWRKDMERRLVPQMENSGAVVSIAPQGDVESYRDIRYALEVGLSILMDKPIIAVVVPGAKVPAKLALVADVIVEGDMKSPDFQKRMAAAVAQVLGRTPGVDLG